MVEDWRPHPGMPPLMRDALDRIVLKEMIDYETYIQNKPDLS